jgi:hypothetical protein
VKTEGMGAEGERRADDGQRQLTARDHSDRRPPSDSPPSVSSRDAADWSRFLGRAELRSTNIRLLALLEAALSRFPSDVLRLRSVAEIRMRKSAPEGTVGLTRYRSVSSREERKRKKAGRGKQTITFYGDLFDKLSDAAATGVIVHELAHAWLNEHVSADSSKRREREADILARSWGYEEYLEALDGETDPY